MRKPRPFLKPMPRYLMRSVNDRMFTCTKVSPDLDPMASYTITISPVDPASCTCHAGVAGKQCRHIKMLFHIFYMFNRIDSGWMFEYDRNLWHEPLTHGEEECPDT